MTSGSRSTAPSGIDLLVLPGMHLLDLACPAQVFAHHTVAWPLRLIGPQRHTTTAQGLQFGHIEPLPKQVDAGRWLIVIGSTNMPALLKTTPGRDTAQWVATHAHQWTRLGAVCAGALVLAQAGVLSGYRATTHHSLLGALRSLSPNTFVEDDALFVDDRTRCTSAGLSSATDLALHLVESVLGESVADSVARDLMIYRRTRVLQQPLSESHRCRHHPDQRVHAVQDRINGDLRVPGGVTALASAVHLSERQLRRRFVAATGHSLRDYIRYTRLAHSETLLRTTSLPIERVAEQSGFSDARALQRLWRRLGGRSPSLVRREHLNALCE
ncbi:MAG: helix-turn-helix domain-containing protein [Pseudomonadota bacterium]